MTKLEQQIRYHLAINASHNSEFSMVHLPTNEILTFEPLTFDFIEIESAGGTYISVGALTSEVINNEEVPIRFLNVQEIELN